MEDVEETASMSRYRKDPTARWAVYTIFDTIDSVYIYREGFRCLKRAMIYANRRRERLSGHKLFIGQYEAGKLDQYSMFWKLKHV